MARLTLIFPGWNEATKLRAYRKRTVKKEVFINTWTELNAKSDSYQ